MECLAVTATLLTSPRSFLVEEGRAGQPKMMSVGLHCRLARPGRVSGLSDFIDFAKSYGREVWICTREEIADFWIDNHSPIGGGSPVKEPVPAGVEQNKEGSTDTESKQSDEAPVEEVEKAEPQKEDIVETTNEEGDVI